MTALDGEARPAVGAGGARQDLEPRHGGDRGQGLAAEAERADMREVAGRQLGGRVAFHGQFEIGRAHAGAVVSDADERTAAGLDLDGDARRPRIERILDELLHGRGRPLDHLAGGDLVDQDGVESADGHGPVLIMIHSNGSENG